MLPTGRSAQTEASLGRYPVQKRRDGVQCTLVVTSGPAIKKLAIRCIDRRGPADDVASLHRRHSRRPHGKVAR